MTFSKCWRMIIANLECFIHQKKKSKMKAEIETTKLCKTNNYFFSTNKLQEK